MVRGLRSKLEVTSQIPAGMAPAFALSSRDLHDIATGFLTFEQSVLVKKCAFLFHAWLAPKSLLWILRTASREGTSSIAWRERRVVSTLTDCEAYVTGA